MYGSTALLTSIVWIISAGIKSNWTFLLSPSAEGILEPSICTEFRAEANPLTTIFLASPWSPCIVIPGTLFKASPIFESGNLPAWSDEIIFVTLTLFFCSFIALACPCKLFPVIIISSPTKTPDSNSMLTSRLVLDTLTSISKSLYPMYDTFNI